jgi:UDP-N-acetylmuramoylalanine--D-glutamate ligase
MQIAGKHILIVGAARSGLAAARFLQARGAHVTINDAKPLEKWERVDELQAQGIKIVAGEHPLALFEKADLIVVSPGVPLANQEFQPARARNVAILGEAELAFRFTRGKTVGITGTNGKTTVTTLIGELLKHGGLKTQVGGNIGTALISLAESSSDDSFTVAELSSFQLEAVEQMHLHVAVFLNLTPDHLDRYDSVEAYGAAKNNLFINQTAHDWAVLNADNEWTANVGDKTPAQKIFFSRERELTAGIFLRGDEVIHRAPADLNGCKERVLLKLADIPLPGTHNLENVMAALGAGLACGVSVESMREAVRHFKAVEHRLEFVAERDGVKFYNDSKATNVDAALKALEAFPGGLVVILGGKDKGSDYAPLAPLVREHCDHVILLGAAAEKIGAALADTKPLHRAVTMKDAVRLGFELAARADSAVAQSGGIVLLAPACASFDMFDSYEHRGRVFKEEVLSVVGSQLSVASETTDNRQPTTDN